MVIGADRAGAADIMWCGSDRCRGRLPPRLARRAPFRKPAPQQIIDLAVGTAVDDPGEDISKIAERLDTAEFAAFDQ